MISLFGKKKKEVVKATPSTNIEDEVRIMSSRGIGEQEIKTALIRKGYNIADIDSAMKNIIKSKITTPPKPPTPKPTKVIGAPPQHGMEEKRPMLPRFEDLEKEINKSVLPASDVLGEIERPRLPTTPIPDLAEERATVRPKPTMHRAEQKKIKEKVISKEEIEGMVEIIVDEKFREFKESIVSKFGNVSELENRIVKIESEIETLKKEIEGRDKEVVEKMENYNRNIEEMNARMQAVETAFKDTLSSMLDSMRALTEEIKSLKKVK